MTVNKNNHFFQPCGIDWGSRKSWGALSTSWNLPNSPRRALWARCGPNIVCSANSIAESNAAMAEQDITLPVSSYVSLGGEWPHESQPVDDQGLNG